MDKGDRTDRPAREAAEGPAAPDPRQLPTVELRRSAIAVRAIGLDAARVQRQRMVVQLEAPDLGHGALAGLDLRRRRTPRRARRSGTPGGRVLALVELEHRLARFEVAARQQSACSNCISTR